MRAKTTWRLDVAYAAFKAQYLHRLTFVGHWFVDGERDDKTPLQCACGLPGVTKSWEAKHIILRAKRDQAFSVWLDAESRALIG